MNWFCKYYPKGGMGENKKCKKDVDFTTLKPALKWEMPCWNDAEKCCPLAEFPNPKERAKFHKLLSDSMEKMAKFMRHETDICIHCGKKVRRLRQEGRSVYGSCGCRMWQGRIPIDWVMVQR